MTSSEPATQASLFDSPAEQPPVYDAAFRTGRVEVSSKPAREILMRATGFMDQYDFTLNPYSGCAFGCTYCYAAFFSRTAERRETWGQWVEVKENAVELIRRRKIGKLDGKCIYMSSVTDPYQPIERTVGLTRGVLQVLADRHAPKLVVQTRSPDVVRDCDLFQQIEERGGRVRVNMTVTTDDEDVRRTFEPFCPSNAQRLEAVTALRSRGDRRGRDDDAAAARERRGGVRAEPAGDGRRALHCAAIPLRARQVRRLDARGRAGADGGEAGLRPGVVPVEVPGTLRRRFRGVARGLPELGEGKDGFAPPF